MKAWTITTLDRSPAMTRTAIRFEGSFAEAIFEAEKIWRDRHDSFPRVCSENDTLWWWFYIGQDGSWENRNTVPTLTGKLSV